MRTYLRGLQFESQKFLEDSPIDICFYKTSENVETIHDFEFLSDWAIFESSFFKKGPIPASFCLFSFFSHSNSSDKYTLRIEKSLDGVHGTWTRSSRIKSADESTELWRDTNIWKFVGINILTKLSVMFGDIMAVSLNITFLIKNGYCYFLGNFW